VYIKKKQYAEAEDLCRKAIALDRLAADTNLNWREVYNAQNGPEDKALEALRPDVPEEKEFTRQEYYRGLSGGSTR